VLRCSIHHLSLYYHVLGVTVAGFIGSLQLFASFASPMWLQFRVTSWQDKINGRTVICWVGLGHLSATRPCQVNGLLQFVWTPNLSIWSLNAQKFYLLKHVIFRNWYDSRVFLSMYDLGVSMHIYPRNRPWRPIGLWDVKYPTFLDNRLTDGGKVVRFPALPDFLRSNGSGTGSTLPREYIWGATWKKK
jgi:hypothetical protein